MSDSSYRYSVRRWGASSATACSSTSGKRTMCSASPRSFSCAIASLLVFASSARQTRCRVSWSGDWWRLVMPRTVHGHHQHAPVSRIPGSVTYKESNWGT